MREDENDTMLQTDIHPATPETSGNLRRHHLLTQTNQLDRAHRAQR